MLTVAKVIGRQAAGYADYLEGRSRASGLGDYYLKDGDRVEAPGSWVGGAREFGLDPGRPVSGAELRALMAVRRPDTGDELRRTGGSGEAVAAIDANFSASKSVSAPGQSPTGRCLSRSSARSSTSSTPGPKQPAPNAQNSAKPRLRSMAGLTASTSATRSRSAIPSPSSARPATQGHHRPGDRRRPRTQVVTLRLADERDVQLERDQLERAGIRLAGQESQPLTTSMVRSPNALGISAEPHVPSALDKLRPTG